MKRFTLLFALFAIGLSLMGQPNESDRTITTELTFPLVLKTDENGYRHAIIGIDRYFEPAGAIDLFLSHPMGERAALRIAKRRPSP